ncbi:hypothetical protein MMC16_007932 [Acarospora aff. strigata]|nr:hypothetical protein [Acarospora aff. strigata]
MQEVQAGVSAAFDTHPAVDATQQHEPQASPAAPGPDAKQTSGRAGQAAAGPRAVADQPSGGAGQGAAGPRAGADQPSGGAGQAAAGPRTLWSEAAELAEARERSQWHELMSRRNLEPGEKLQVKLLSHCWAVHGCGSSWHDV